MPASISSGFAQRAVAFAVAALVVTTLSGCGRRGDLEPPSANAVQSPQAKNDLSGRRANPKITPPKKDFVLDPLLQ